MILTLGIETSCDETSCAVMRGKNKVLSNIVSSSLFRHKDFGGVVPEIASRHSLEQIEAVYEEALQTAGIKEEELELIAVTEGPGLIGSLFVGVCFAKALSYRLGIPLVGVNHLEAHLVSNFIEEEEPERYIGLLVSGGHTMLTLHEKGSVKLLGETADDAVGEAYDKAAKILGLPFPGGPMMDQLSGQGNPNAVKFTLPKQNNPYDFSFSGIKTAVLYLVRDSKTGLDLEDRPSNEDIAASFQSAAIGWIVKKALAACEEYQASHLVVGGGVSANSYLRELLAEKAGEKQIKVWIPPLELTGDNGAMIARAGLNLAGGDLSQNLRLNANPSLRLVRT